MDNICDRQLELYVVFMESMLYKIHYFQIFYNTVLLLQPV